MKVLAEARVIIHHQDARLTLPDLLGLLRRRGRPAARRAEQFGVLVGVIDRFQAALHVQLAVEARQVVFNGLHTQSSHLGQRLVIQALPQITEQLLSSSAGKGRADHRTLGCHQFLDQRPRDPTLAGQNAQSPPVVNH